MMKHTDSDLHEVLRATVAVIEWQTLGIELGMEERNPCNTSQKIVKITKSFVSTVA